VSDALDSGPLSPEAWRIFGPLVDAALDTPTERRAAFIADACRGDDIMAEQLRRLVDECEQGDPLLDAGAIERFGSLLDDDATSRFPSVLAERYRVEREIGRGGMAIVFLAHDTTHDRSVAVKVLRPSARKRIGTLRFSAEIRTTAGLRHPRIVPLYDSGETDEALYYVMPYYASGTLAARLEHEPQPPLRDALAIAADIAAALEYAHGAGLIHRDIKPSNILFADGRAVLADFGVAREAQRTERGLTSTGVVIGTPTYMSPEQATGQRALDVRSDIYSLGCVLFEMITGETPVTATSAKTPARHALDTRRRLGNTRQGLPPSLERCVVRATAKDPADRFASARELAQALAECGEQMENARRARK
jgi:eukaryotic-like serine/threonine-protein kinase